ncbi:MAG: ParB/RepB/Spo0J family partition protein [Oscillospiraceae bacterium]|nr:ParB/RepB/Spo0J family partition protein [Oscillospiraceae bacterium]MDD6085175.1 ParB/RepB/Spo0J family partition protein [Oscillospiraceae bacterium]MDY3256736.1 ParB/RepB/Spo0J family partition protein [Ruminococcus callidus]
MAKGGLGSGLDILFDENVTETQTKKTLRVSQIEPNRNQPRKQFSEEAVTSLAESIREHGMLQPILVRPYIDGQYQIVAGERRWRAARMLGLDEVPVIIKDIADVEAMQMALIENLQRENLNPIEEATGYKRLSEEFNMKQDDIAKTVGKSRSSVANMLRILTLPNEVQEMLVNGEISVGHAKALLSIDDEEVQIEAARRAKDGSFTVRHIEKLAQSLAENTDEAEEKPPKPVKIIDSYYKEVELSLNERLGRKVKVDFTKNKGTLVLEFYDKDDLAALADKIANIDL